MKEWNGQRYNTDFEPIDAAGNVLGPKDEAASAGWTQQNEPWRDSPGWHAQPLSAQQEASLRQTNPQGYAERQAWRSANPTTAIGAPMRRTPMPPGPRLGGGVGVPPPSLSGMGGSYTAPSTRRPAMSTFGPAQLGPLGRGDMGPTRASQNPMQRYLQSVLR